jgi:hypothetical protein
VAEQALIGGLTVAATFFAAYFGARLGVRWVQRRPPVELRASGVQTLGVDMLQAHVSELRRQLDELRMVVNSMLVEQREAREEPHPRG